MLIIHRAGEITSPFLLLYPVRLSRKTSSRHWKPFPRLPVRLRYGIRRSCAGFPFPAPGPPLCWDAGKSKGPVCLLYPGVQPVPGSRMYQSASDHPTLYRRLESRIVTQEKPKNKTKTKTRITRAENVQATITPGTSPGNLTGGTSDERRDAEKAPVLGETYGE